MSIVCLFVVCYSINICLLKSLVNSNKSNNPIFRSYIQTLSKTVYMLGMLIGSCGFGWFGDHFGRRKNITQITHFLQYSVRPATGLILFIALRCPKMLYINFLTILGNSVEIINFWP